MLARRSHSQLQKARRQFQGLAWLPPMVSGSFVEQYVICATPRCRCPRGQKHGPLYYLYWKEQGRSRSLYVSRERVTELRRQIENHHHFQTALARLLQLQRLGWQRRIREESRR